MSKKKDMYLYDDENGNEVFGTMEDYFEMKDMGVSKKPPFWKIW